MIEFENLPSTQVCLKNPKKKVYSTNNNKFSNSIFSKKKKQTNKTILFPRICHYKITIMKRKKISRFKKVEYTESDLIETATSRKRERDRGQSRTLLLTGEGGGGDW